MTYIIRFTKAAQKEWEKLDDSVKCLFARKLNERRENPRIPSAALSIKDCYKIKLRSQGYRLVYRVVDDQLLVVVIAVGKRDNMAVYKVAESRLARLFSLLLSRSPQ